MQALIATFKERSIVAQESVHQARAIRNLVDAATFGPPSDGSNSDGAGDSDADGHADFKDHELARAREILAAQRGGAPLGEADEAVVIAVALSERKAAAEARRVARGKRSPKTSGSGPSSGAGSIRIRYDQAAAEEDEAAAAEADELAKELESQVTVQEEGRQIQNMVLMYQAKERPAPPAFDSTAVSLEMEQLGKEAADAMLAAEAMLRSVMDPTGKAFQPNIFDGEIARLQYRFDVMKLWLEAAGEHARKYQLGANAIQQGVSQEVNVVRKGVLDDKETCELLGRQCERKKLECEVAARKHEAQIGVVTLLRLLSRPPRDPLPNAPEQALDTTTADDATAVTTHEDAATTLRRQAPRIPRRFLRPAFARLRHILTATQSHIFRGGGSVQSLQADETVLKAIEAVLKTLKGYEDARRDEATVDVAAGDANSPLGGLEAERALFTDRIKRINVDDASGDASVRIGSDRRATLRPDADDEDAQAAAQTSAENRGGSESADDDDDDDDGFGGGALYSEKSQRVFEALGRLDRRGSVASVGAGSTRSPRAGASVSATPNRARSPASLL